MEPNQIRFTPGQPFMFIATRKFALGATGVDIMEGMEVLFDGTVVEVNGSKYTLPQLRGSLKLGWLVLAEEYDPEAPVGPRQSANIQVRSAVSTNQNPLAPAAKSPITTTESDERVVMTHGQRTAAASQTTQQARAAARPAGGGGVARSFGNGGDVEVGGAEFGVPVARSFLTSAKATTEVTRDSVGQAIMAADKVKVQPGQGLTEEQMLAAMSDDDREAYLAKKEAAKANVTSRLNPNYSGPPVTKVAAAPAQARTVGRVKTSRSQTSEGITATVTTGGGTETFDASGSSRPAEQTVTEIEGMRFTNTNGPKRGVQAMPAVLADDQIVSKIEKDGTADARRKIAKALCPDFPDAYSFSDHWKRRLAMIRLNYEGRADVIRAIFAAESDDFKKVLMEEFPEVFSA